MKKIGWLLFTILLIGAAMLLLPSVLHKPRPHSVTLSWHAPSESARSSVVSYNIYRNTTKQGAYVRLASEVKGLTYHDTAVNPGATYFYVVRSVDREGHESPASEEIRVTVPED